MARTLKQILEDKGTARAALLKYRDDTDAKVTAEKRAAWTKEEDAKFAEISAHFDALTAEEGRARKFEEIEQGERNKPGREDVAPGQGGGRSDPIDDDTRARAIVGWLAEQAGEGATEEEVEAARTCRLNLRSRTLTIPVARTTDMRRLQEVRRSVFGAEREAALRGVELRNLSVGSNVAGGYIAAPPEMVRRLEMAMLDFGGIYELAEVIRTANANPIGWPSANDTTNTGEWLDEGGDTTTVDSVDPTFKKTTWFAHKVSSKPIRVSFELLRDSIFDLPGVIGAMLGERIGRAKAAAFATGSGAGKPRGLTLDTALGKAAAGGAAITTDEIIDLVHSVDPAYRKQGCAFLMKDSTVQLIRKLKDSTNQYLWQPGMQAGQPNVLYGYPVHTSQDMPAATTGLKSVVFGQMSAYKVREVGAIRLRRFDELYGETDETGFIAFHEADGGLLDAGGNPLKHLLQA